MIKTISIIGGTGKMGSIFASAFQEKGYNIIISSKSTPITVEETASQGDLVIITVPINVTEDVIKKYSRSNVVSSHPLFGPGVSINGQTIVLCNVRGSKFSELRQLYQSIGLKVVEMSPKEHDKQ